MNQAFSTMLAVVFLILTPRAFGEGEFFLASGLYPVGQSQEGTINRVSLILDSDGEHFQIASEWDLSEVFFSSMDAANTSGHFQQRPHSGESWEADRELFCMPSLTMNRLINFLERVANRVQPKEVRICSA